MTLGRWAGAYDIVADCFLLTSKRQDLGVRSLCVESGEGVGEGVREGDCEGGSEGGSEGGRVERKKPFADKPALKASAACVRRRIHVSLQISPP